MTTNNLQPWTVLNQRTDPTVDGAPPEDAFYQCGAADAAMVALNIRGVRVPVDTAKDEILGQGKVDVISIAALRSWFAKYCPGMATSEHYPAANAASLTALIKSYVDLSQPMIELRYFQYPGNTALHFTCPIDYDAERIYFANSWSAAIDSETYADHAAMSRYVLIGIDETRSPNL